MASSSSLVANYDAPAYGLLITFIVITTITISIRAWARRIQKVEVGADDILAYLSYALNLGNMISLLVLVAMGSMNLQKSNEATPQMRKTTKQSIQTSSILYNFTMIAVKMCMLMLFRRIFTLNQKWFRVFWWVNIIWIFPLWTALTFGLFIYLETKNSSFAAENVSFGIAAGSCANAVSDIMLLVLPVRSVMRLKLSKLHRLGIIGLFCLGLLTTLVSLARMSMAFYQANHKLPWNPAYASFVSIIFSAAETSAAVMCVCLPIAKPVISSVSQLAKSGISSLASLVSSSRSSSAGSQRHRYASSRSSSTNHTSKYGTHGEKSHTVNTKSSFVSPQQHSVDVESLYKSNL